MDTIILDGDFMYPVKEYNNNTPISLDDTVIPSNLTNEIYDWVKRYDVYTAMTKAELEPHHSKVEQLDKEGVQLLRKIRDNAKCNLAADKYYYFSLCFDKTLIVLYSDGKEKEL